ncbi:MAG: hypothetical protein AAGF04_02955 [Chlamydiota bacterium]
MKTTPVPPIDPIQPAASSYQWERYFRQSRCAFFSGLFFLQEAIYDLSAYAYSYISYALLFLFLLTRDGFAQKAYFSLGLWEGMWAEKRENRQIELQAKRYSRLQDEGKIQAKLREEALQGLHEELREQDENIALLEKQNALQEEAIEATAKATSVEEERKECLRKNVAEVEAFLRGAGVSIPSFHPCDGANPFPSGASPRFPNLASLSNGACPLRGA